jgi:hypothetical protein
MHADTAEFDILSLLLRRSGEPGIPGERCRYRPTSASSTIRLVSVNETETGRISSTSMTKEVIPSLLKPRLLRAHDAHDLVQLAGVYPKLTATLKSCSQTLASLSPFLTWT